MDTSLPGIVVTGASGFVGRHFLASAAGRYRLFCLARRSQREVGVPDYDNLRWSQVDIANWDTLREVVNCVKRNGGADAVLHLAGYYDFHNMEHPEYERTNVLGTRNVLKLARQLGVGRFIFASSLAACNFPASGEIIDEDSETNASFAYARSKHAGEEMIREHAEYFPSAIVRMAAIFSDWCEYPPLYVFLRTWLSEAWNARILGGRGESAVPYLHVSDLVRLMLRIVELRDELPRVVVYNASPEHCTTHRELFDAATRDFFGGEIQPRLLPRALATVGVSLRWWLGKLLGKPPFEAPWMMSYIDRQLRVDPSRTQAALDWRPMSRLDVSRRLLLMVENMKSHQEVWHHRNETALRRVSQRPNLLIAEVLEDQRDDLVERLVEIVVDPRNSERFCNYHALDRESLQWFTRLLYQVLVISVRTCDRQFLRHYAQLIATRRREEGFAVDQVQDFLATVGHTVVEALRVSENLVGLEQAIHDHVGLAFQLTADSVEDAYEALAQPLPETLQRYRTLELPSSPGDLERLVHQLEETCSDVLLQERDRPEAR